MADLSSIYAAQLRRPTMADLLMRQGSSMAPAQGGIGEGLARALMGGMAGWLEKKDETAAGQEFDALYGKAAAPAPAYDPKAVGAALSGDQSQPRGIRNNNPLNIEAGDFTKGQPGFAGSDGRFARFEQPQQGLAAAGKLLDTYQSKHGLNTVRGIIGRWAPSGENNTSAYVASVAGRMGVDPDQPLTPEQRPALIAAMGQFENGRPISQQQQTAQTDPAALPPNATPTQGYAIPGQQPQQRQAPQIPPDVLTRARSLYQKGDPVSQARAAAMLEPYTKPKDQWRPVTDPAERAKYGISPEDKNAYQVGTDNQIKAINPQPFAVNVNNQQESEFKKEGGSLIAKRFNEYVKGGDDARSVVADIGALRDIGSRITTGKTAEITAALGPYAQAVGVKIDSLPDLEAYNAIVAKIQPRMRVAGSGATSDYEMQQFLKALPSIGKTPEGNALITNTMDALQQHKLKAAEIAGAALEGTISQAEANKQIRELPDPMEMWRKSKGKLPTDRGEAAPTVIDGYTIKRVK